MLQIDRLIEKSKSSITIKSFFACENSTLDGKGKGEEGKSSDIDRNKADDVLDSEKDRKEEKTENNDNDSLLLYNMQFCILRVLKSNFLRMKEQQRSGDLVGLIYFPLNYSSIKSTESNVNDNDDNNNKDNNNKDNNDNDIDNNNNKDDKDNDNNNNNKSNNINNNNNNIDEDIHNDSGMKNNVGIEKQTRNEGRIISENCPYSHLTVFQLLNSLLKCIAGQPYPLSSINFYFL